MNIKMIHFLKEGLRASREAGKWDSWMILMRVFIWVSKRSEGEQLAVNRKTGEHLNERNGVKGLIMGWYGGL